jgi:hypothetical protein
VPFYLDWPSGRSLWLLLKRHGTIRPDRFGMRRCGEGGRSTRESVACVSSSCCAAKARTLTLPPAYDDDDRIQHYAVKQQQQQQQDDDMWIRKRGTRRGGIHCTGSSSEIPAVRIWSGACYDGTPNPAA